MINPRNNMNSKLVVITAALAVVLAAPAAGDASGYLHQSEAQFMATKIGVQLDRVTHARSWKLTGCARLGSSTVMCGLVLHGVPDSLPKMCSYTVIVRKKRDGSIFARGANQICEADR